MVRRDPMESIACRKRFFRNLLRSPKGEDDTAFYPATLTVSNTRFSGSLEKKALSGVIA